MRELKLVWALLAAFMLSACVGFVVPLPLSTSSSDETSQNHRR